MKICLTVLSMCFVLSLAELQGFGDDPGGPKGRDGLGGPGGRQQEGGQRTPPRGDDPRPRSWGKPNDRNETEFDDRTSPRKVSFLGRAADMRIYPNYSDTSVFLQLRFGKVSELDAGGHPIPEHSINSLADPESMLYAAGNSTYGGINMSYVNLTLDPRARREFRECRGPLEEDDDDPHRRSRSRSLLESARPPAPAGQFAPKVGVSLLFGLDDMLVLPYGSANVTVPRNGLKWTVSYENWPFCNETHSLSVTLDILLSFGAAAQVTESAIGGMKTLTLSLGPYYNASLGFYDYALDSANGSIKMPANVTISQSGPLVRITMALPNPRRYNANSVWYDPTQVTNSYFLSADDPGNSQISATADSSTKNATQSGANTSVTLRLSLWAVVAAMLLSAFLNGGLGF